MVTPRRLAAALSSLSAVLVVVPVAIVAVVIGPSSFCVVLPLACARLRAKKKGRSRMGTTLVRWDVLRQGRSGQRPSGSLPRLRAKTSEPPQSLLPVPDIHGVGYS